MLAIDLVREFSRSADTVQAVLEATQISAAAIAPQDGVNDLQNRRVLAVISHKDDWDLTEEGSVFVFKYRPLPATTATGQSEELDLQMVFPIYGDFSIVMSQLKRGTMDLRAPGTTKSVLDQPRTALSLTITPAEGLQNDAVQPTYFTYDVQALKTFVSEGKRLKEVCDVDANAVINLAQSTTHFSWLKPYFAKRTSIGALTAMPQDLRQINLRLKDRLSPASAGMTADEHADIQVMRDDWIRIKAQEASRKGRRRLTLRLGTFNVNGKMPTQDLSAWVQGNVSQKPQPTPKSETEEEVKVAAASPVLPPVRKTTPLNPFSWITRRPKSATSETETLVEEKEEIPIRVDLDDPEDPDILAFGFQELDLSTEALLYSTSTVREDAWYHAILAALGEKAVKYEKLASRQLVGMLMLIVVKKSLKNCFEDVKTSSAGAGLLGVMGNKGGTAIRFSFTPPALDPDHNLFVKYPGPTTFTFVNAHLAAFDEMVDKRNSDFQDLSKRLAFENPTLSGRSNSPASSDPEESKNGDSAEATTSAQRDEVAAATAVGLNPPLSVYETDALFWVGDLNYRVDVPDTDMRRYLRDEEWDAGPKFEALLRFDQLKKAQRGGKAFVGFQESNVTHFPTYRFSPGLAMDRLGYDLKRKPAWTDRVLHMHGPAVQVNQLSYTGHPQIMMSDHRPVAANFEVDVDIYDTEDRKANIHKYFNQVVLLDTESSHDKGGLKVDDTFLDFDKLYYGKPVERTLVVRNVGKAPCAFRFVPIQLDSPIHPEWLEIRPMAGVLLPGEVSQITLRAEIDNATASMLNLRSRDLSGTLILHTILGKDHFISVSGEYQYTCFANHLSRLTRLRGPIRAMSSPSDLLDENHPRNAPKEIMRLVDWMMKDSAIPDGLFLSSGSEDVVDTIRECLDTGDEFPYTPESATASPEVAMAFATTLLRFLDSLTEPIIPASLHARCLEMSNRDEAFELLDELTPVSVNVWISITAFLHFICQGPSTIENRTQKTAEVIAPILMRDDPNSTHLPISPKRKSQFLLYFIS